MEALGLRESEAKVVALSGEQAAALAALGQRLASSAEWWGQDPELDGESATPTSVISVVPHSPGKWTVRVSDAVGLVVVEGCQFIVEPKIPAEHLLYLWSRGPTWPRLDEGIGALAPDRTLFELVVHWYLNSLEVLMRGDLLRDYRDEEDRLTAVRGQLHVIATATQYYTGDLAFTCNFQEFDVDTPINRILKAAALAILRNDVLKPALRRRAQRAVMRMDEVGELELTDLRATLDSRTKSYRQALLLARHVLAAQARALSSGGTLARCFLIRTPSMVEDGIRQCLKEGLQDLCSVRRGGRQLKGSPYTINPDLWFQPLPAVGDVKYKMTVGQWSRADLYQSVAFAVGFEVHRAAIVSFVSATAASPLVINVGHVAVRGLEWVASETWTSAQAEAYLVHQARAWLTRDVGLDGHAAAAVASPAGWYQGPLGRPMELADDQSGRSSSQ